MASNPFADVHAALVEVMTDSARALTVTTDKPGNVTVESVDVDSKGKPRWFGAVQSKKNYVSYHLMPVYEDPSLLDAISHELKARMQGTSCFNFKTIDEALFEELRQLTEASVEAFTASRSEHSLRRTLLPVRGRTARSRRTARRLGCEPVA